MAHFNEKWYNKQLELEIPQLKISDDTLLAFIAPMRGLVNKYADIFTKPSKNLLHKILSTKSSC